jgi:hypothetical protein
MNADRNPQQYRAGEMLAKLSESLAVLPDILLRREAWDSLIVNRRKPFTYRVFTTLPSGLRLCLHKFDPCHTHEAFAHPHPWPGAFAVLRGRYRMVVGYSRNRHDAPAEVTTLELNAHSCYEIINPLTWHAVVPLVPTHTVMVNGAPWDTETTAHTSVRTTRGKDLDKMPEAELLDHLAVFRELVREWNDRPPSRPSPSSE